MQLALLTSLAKIAREVQYVRIKALLWVGILVQAKHPVAL